MKYICPPFQTRFVLLALTYTHDMLALGLGTLRIAWVRIVGMS